MGVLSVGSANRRQPRPRRRTGPFPAAGAVVPRCPPGPAWTPGWAANAGRPGARAREGPLPTPPRVNPPLLLRPPGTPAPRHPGTPARRVHTGRPSAKPRPPGPDFVASIRDSGVQEPVAVRREDDGTLVVRKGQRRTPAVASAGLDRVDVLVDGNTAAEGETAARIERIVDQRCGPVPLGCAGLPPPAARGPPADVTSTSR